MVQFLLRGIGRRFERDSLLYSAPATGGVLTLGCGKYDYFYVCVEDARGFSDVFSKRDSSCRARGRVWVSVVRCGSRCSRVSGCVCSNSLAKSASLLACRATLAIARSYLSSRWELVGRGWCCGAEQCGVLLELGVSTLGFG